LHWQRLQSRFSSYPQASGPEVHAATSLSGQAGFPSRVGGSLTSEQAKVKSSAAVARRRMGAHGTVRRPAVNVFCAAETRSKRRSQQSKRISLLGADTFPDVSTAFTTIVVGPVPGQYVIVSPIPIATWSRSELR
jgi:hypothetical protein